MTPPRVRRWVQWRRWYELEGAALLHQVSGGVDQHPPGPPPLLLLLHLPRSAGPIQGARGEREGGRLCCFFNAAEANASGNESPRPHHGRLRLRGEQGGGASSRHAEETGTEWVYNKLLTLFQVSVPSMVSSSFHSKMISNNIMSCKITGDPEQKHSSDLQEIK